MKRALLFIVVPIVLVFIGAIFAPNFINIKSYQSQISDLVQQQTGLNLTLNGEVELSLIPSPRLMVNDAVLSDGQAGVDVLSFERLDVHLNLMPLFSGQVSVSSLLLVKPVLNLSEKLEKIFQALDTKTLSVDNAVDVSVQNFDLSFDNIYVKQGEIHYKNMDTSGIDLISNMNADIRFPSLSGPFDVQGSFFYVGQAYDFDIKTGAYSDENESLEIETYLKVKPENVVATYKGILFFKDHITSQGRIKIETQNLKSSLANVTGDMHLKKNVQAVLSGLMTLDETALKCSSCIIDFAGERVQTDLVYELVSQSARFNMKTPNEVSLDSVFDSAIPINTAFFTLSGEAKKSDDGVVVINSQGALSLDSFEIEIKNLSAHLDGEAHPDVSVNLTVSDLDLDQYLNEKINQSNDKNKVLTKTNNTLDLTGFSLPVNVSGVIVSTNLKWNGIDFKNIALKGSIKNNKLNVSSFSIKDYVGASLDVNGEINNIENMSGVSLYADSKIQDVDSFMQSLSIESAPDMQGIGKVSVKATLKGGKENLDVTVNAKVLDADVLAKGRSQYFSGGASFSDFVLQVKHEDAAKFFKNLAQVDLPENQFSKPFDLYTKVNEKNSTYELTDIKAVLSDVTVSGEMHVNLNGAKPDISGDLEFGDITLDAFIKKERVSSSTSSTKSIPKSSVSQWSKSVFDTSAFHALNLSLDVNADSIKYGEWPLIKPKGKIQLKDGDFKISDLKAKVFDGSVEVYANVKASDQPRHPIYFESKSEFKNVDLNSLSKALIGTQFVDTSGKGALDLNLKSSGASSSALIHDLSGNGVVSGENIILNGVDFKEFARAFSADTKLGESLDSFWSGAQGSGSTTFDTLDGAFDIQQGNINIASMDLDGASTKVGTTGSIDLSKWSLASKHLITVKDDDRLEPFEISFNGPLNNPSQTFGKGLLQDFLNRKVERKFNKILSEQFSYTNDNQQDETDESSEERQEEPATIEDLTEDVIKDVIGDLFR